MKNDEFDKIEINLLLDAIFHRYGYDFRNYAPQLVKNRIKHRLAISGLNYISEMIPKILYNDEFIDIILRDMSVTVTDMFRDPEVFKTIRQRVIPKLRNCPRINIWNAGCATGEEVYSMAIIMTEEGLEDKTHIYATDFNNQSLAKAEKGVFPLEKIQMFTKNYVAAAGKNSFANYYYAKYNSAKMKESLRKMIKFAHHNLITDGVFAEMHLILCRNVLIYFQQNLQDQVLNLLTNSLDSNGFLVLGDKGAIEFSDVEDKFEVFARNERIYRKKSDL